MTIDFYRSIVQGVLIGGDGSSGTSSGYALDSNYALGSAGDCVGIRFVAPIGSVHIHSVYFFLHAANATSHDLTCDLTAYNSSSSTRANTTPIRTVTSSGGTTANKWIKFDFSSYSDSLTGGEIYWVSVGDASGSGSGYSIRKSSSAITGANTSKVISSYTNDAGFTTNGTASGTTLCGIIVFSDGSAMGCPYSSSSLPNTALERGIRFIFDEKVVCSGITANLGSSNLSTLQIYSDSTAPNGTVWSGFNSGSAYTIPEANKTAGSIIFPSAVTFEKNTYYRLTLKSSSAHTTIGYSGIDDLSTLESDAIKCALGAGSWCYIVDNGSGGWTNYNNGTNGYALARISLIVKSQVAITSGSSGGSYAF